MAQSEPKLHELDALLRVAASLVNDPMYHECKGPSCALCMALPEAYADYQEATTDAQH